jgi:4'-phosphopantetheinyl transferase
MVAVWGRAWPQDATVDVWVAPLDAPPPVLDRLSAALSPAERRRAAAYRSASDARRFSAARGWLRHVLGDVLGLEPAAVPVSEDPGKPRLLLGGPPRFNLSHAGELVVVAVASFEVGVDVEDARSGRRWSDVAPVTCSPREAAALAEVPEDEREEAFLAVWTAKEAYLKATGEGLAVPPERVVVGRPVPDAHTAVRVDDGEPRWWVRPVRPADGYVGAVAAEGTRWGIRMRPTSVLDSHQGQRAQRRPEPVRSGRPTEDERTETP